MKNFLKKLCDFIIHFIRRVLYFVTMIFVGLSCTLIFLVTYEPGTRGIATPRKMRRIKLLTKFKLYAWKYFSWYFKFIHYSCEYQEDVYNKFHFLIDK